MHRFLPPGVSRGRDEKQRHYHALLCKAATGIVLVRIQLYLSGIHRTRLASRSDPQTGVHERLFKLA